MTNNKTTIQWCQPTSIAQLEIRKPDLVLSRCPFERLSEWVAFMAQYPHLIKDAAFCMIIREKDLVTAEKQNYSIYRIRDTVDIMGEEVSVAVVTNFKFYPVLYLPTYKAESNEIATVIDLSTRLTKAISKHLNKKITVWEMGAGHSAAACAIGAALSGRCRTSLAIEPAMPDALNVQLATKNNVTVTVLDQQVAQ